MMAGRVASGYRSSRLFGFSTRAQPNRPPADTSGMRAIIDSLTGLPSLEPYIAGRCGRCRRGDRSLRWAVFYRQIGLFYVRLAARRGGMLCGRCALWEFAQMTLPTMLCGWWGLISLFITPFVLLHNIATMVGFAVGRPHVARRGLEDYREYAANLLATKDRDTVVEVLTQRTGAPAEKVRAFVDAM